MVSRKLAEMTGHELRRNRIRVLHVIQSLNYGGMERLLADIVSNLNRTSVESHILCLHYLGRFAEGLGAVAELHLADPLPRHSMLWPGPLIRQISRIGPDVVHTHSGVWYKASLAARRAMVARVVHTEHGRRRPDPWQDRFIDGRASRRTDVVIAVSDALGRQLLATKLAKASQVQVIPNGVDTGRFRPSPDTGVIRQRLGIAPEVPVIGSIGRLEPIKGYDVMIAALAALLRREYDGLPPVLLIAGEGSERPRLEHQIRHHGLEDSVRLLGWSDEVHDFHAACTIFTLSSRSEGTSISLLEAMSAGLCPVVTDVGGNAAVLGPRLRHRLVSSEDPAALAAAWYQALRQRDQREADAQAARKRIVESFGLDRMVASYEAVYHGA